MSKKSPSQAAQKKPNRTIGFVRNHSTAILSILLLGSIAANTTQLVLSRRPEALLPAEGVNINATQSMSEIEAYLDSIGPQYMQDEQALAKQANIPSWGCGPSSYALAVILDKKFFDDKLPINAAYESSEPYEIVERFSLHQKGNEIADHNWIEIYYNNTFLFVDPSLAQFGQVNKVIYQQFNVNDPNISTELENEYGIVDLRVGLLLNKAINRIPAADNPYPNVAIDPSLISYYTEINDDRTDVENHKVPADWTVWVNYLVNKYAPSK